jgi:hypothetical protein
MTGSGPAEAGLVARLIADIDASRETTAKTVSDRRRRPNVEAREAGDDESLMQAVLSARQDTRVDDTGLLLFGGNVPS